MEADPGYWSQRRWTSYIRGKNIMKGIEEGTVEFYKRDWPIDWKTFPTNGIRQRYIIYNTTTPNWLYKIDTRGDDCSGHPDISVIDFIR
jgi:hypothetical protein